MNTHFTYYLVDLLCFVFPFIFSFHPSFQFYRQWRSFLPALILPALFFIAWDCLFTHWGVWSFNSAYTFEPRFINLPLEEVLFFFCIPYPCLFTYHCIRLYVNTPGRSKTLNVTVILLITLLLIVAGLSFQKLYTSVTFVLLALYLAYLLYKKVKYLGAFFLCFIFIQPFFFVSNGLLTGSFIAEPVVIYNPLHNLGIRMFTIPFEDLFYAMLLILMNTSLFEYFKTRNARLSRPLKKVKKKRY